jgi:hypothetical protein
MKIRKNRIHQSGISNLDYRLEGKENEAIYRAPNHTSIDFLS